VRIYRYTAVSCELFDRPSLGERSIRPRCMCRQSKQQETEDSNPQRAGETSRGESGRRKSIHCQTEVTLGSIDDCIE